MNPTVVMAVLFGIGFLCGLRAFAPLALISWMSVWGWTPVAGSPFWFIGHQAFAITLSILAILELVGDKLPKTPPRIQVMPLVGRCVSGGMAAAALAVAAGRPWLHGLLLGPIGSVVGAFGGYYVRRSVVAKLRLPDLIVALVEDFVTIAGTLFLVHNFFHAGI